MEKAINALFMVVYNNGSVIHEKRSIKHGITVRKEVYILSESESNMLKEVLFFLRPFENYSVYLQGRNYATMNFSTCCYESLIDHCNNSMNILTQNDLQQGIIDCLQKLAKYYYRGSLISIGGILLDPQGKTDYCKRHKWGSDTDILLDVYN